MLEKPARLFFALTSRCLEIQSIKLHYRHVNQIEYYQIEPMKGKDGAWSYTIPSNYLKSNYPLMFFFELLDDKGNAWLYPDYELALANQHLLSRASSGIISN